MEETTSTEAVEIPAQFKTLVETIEKMSVMELSDLVKVLEKKFGVSAAVVAAPAPATPSEAQEEKTSFALHLADAGANKIAIIKVVKEVLGLGLKEAKDLVDGAPVLLKADMKKEDAEAVAKKIAEAGGKAELK